MDITNANYKLGINGMGIDIQGQQIRKTNDYDVMDNIRILLDADDAVFRAVDIFEDYIKTETLAIEIVRVEDSSLEKANLNDHMTGIRLEKIIQN